MSRSNSPKRRHRQKGQGRTEAHRPDGMRTCSVSGKNCYPSRKAGLTELNRLRANPPDTFGLIDGEPTVPTAIYKCVHCRAFHLTSQRR